MRSEAPTASAKSSLVAAPCSREKGVELIATRKATVVAGPRYGSGVLFVALLVLPSVVSAQEGRIRPPVRRALPMAVQTTARVKGQATLPEYPLALRVARVEGEVLLQFLVDPRGEVDSIRVVAATHPLFADAARDALLRRKYLPALQEGRPARQWIQERFVFRPRN